MFSSQILCLGVVCKIQSVQFISCIFILTAEKFLEGVEVNQNYAILLLHLIDKDGVDMTIRVAAAIAFKNFIKRNWPVVISLYFTLQ